MLATGIKSPVGIKIAGPDLGVIERIAAEVEALVRGVPGAASVFAERVGGGRYVEIVPDRLRAARHGLSIDDIQRTVALGIGGGNIGEVVDGLARFPINLRFPRELRDSVTALRALPLLGVDGAVVPLGSIASVEIKDGPPMIKSENARPAGYIYVDIRDRSLGGFVDEARRRVDEGLQLPPGYSLAWSGQFEYLARATQRLQLVVPLTLALIFMLLLLSFRRAGEALLIMTTLPFALIGGLWLMYALGHQLSVASAVGFIALAGVAAEFGVIMLLYLRQAMESQRITGEAALRAAIVEGAVMRVRPKAMTVATILVGLLPLFWGSGTGSEVMQRIAAPMLGGMLSAPLLSMLVLPAAMLLIERRRLAGAG
jgi:copper/silver efflux system protein